MTINVKKGLISSEDIRHYTAASPTFYRGVYTGSGGTNITSLSATNIVLSNASFDWTVNNVERALNEIMGRYVSKGHSTATYDAGASPGDHINVFGFKNGLAATSIQAAASNQYLAEGYARIVIPDGTFTQATPIALPRKTFIFGNGHDSVIRASSTIQTSRVFSVSGSIGATNSALIANATFSKTIVSVTDGTKFSADDWILIRDSKNSELNQVRSVSGNDLTMHTPARHTYRTAATVSHASIAYPAELHMDNLSLEMSSGTQGIGVAGTYLVRSVFGEGLRISGAEDAGIRLADSEHNTINAEITNAQTRTGGKGYGVHLSGESQDNKIGGIRAGVNKDVSGGGAGNFQWGIKSGDLTAASGVCNPMGMWYRSNKPQLVWDNSGSTIRLACAANVNRETEVYIDGRPYRNAATAYCLLSSQASPTNNVWGRTEATRYSGAIYHVYAVPKLSSSATKQFELIADTSGPATGPRFNFPNWSWLGPVALGSPAHLIRFGQSGNDFHLDSSLGNFFTEGGNVIAAQATVKVSAVLTEIPIMTNKSYVYARRSEVALATSRTGGGGELYSFVSPIAGSGLFGVRISGLVFGTGGIGISQSQESSGWVPTKNQQIGYLNAGVAATGVVVCSCNGYSVDRSLYK